MPILLQRHLYSCQAFVQSLTIEITTCHIRNAFLMTLGLLFALMFMRISLVFSKISHLKQRTVSYRNSRCLHSIVAKLKLENDLSLIESHDQFAFCFGLSKPHIYISTELLRKMSKPELEAIILHERYHLHHHDSLTLFVASVMLMAFPFFPVLATLIWNYRLKAEIQADQAAIQTQKSKVHLVSVLRKMLLVPSQSSFAAAAIADQTLETRIEYLIKGQLVQPPIPIASLSVSVTSVALLLGIIFVPTTSTSIQLELQPKNTEVCIGGKSCAIKCSTAPQAAMSPLAPLSSQL